MAETSIASRLFPVLRRSQAVESARNFGKSMGLLGLALLAALYSSTSARNGQFLAAVLGAVLALGVALWVAWRLVPRLAASVEWGWLPYLSRISLTREGWACVASTLVVAATAVNTSNNLLYMILSSLIAVLLLSIVLAGINLRSIEVGVSVPKECFARQPFPMALTVRNPKKVFPTISIRISPDAQTSLRFVSAYLAIVPAGRTESLHVETACNRRGRHPLGTIRVESRFPFGFLVKTVSLPVDAECIAYPEIQDAEPPELSARDILGPRARIEKGQGSDLYMIRDYQTSDSARTVDWKASAKTAVLKTREFAAEETRRVVILFDRYGRRGEEERFESLVSRAASAAHALAETHVEISFVSDDWSSRSGGSDQTLRLILRYLALVQMDATARSCTSSHAGETLSFSLR